MGGTHTEGVVVFVLLTARQRTEAINPHAIYMLPARCCGARNKKDAGDQFVCVSRRVRRCGARNEDDQSGFRELVRVCGRCGAKRG